MNQKRAVAIDDLFEIDVVGDAQISPDGRRVAFVRKRMDREKDDYVTNIFLSQDGGTRQYTTGDKDSTPRWSPDGETLAFMSKREGKTRLFLLPAAGGEAYPLTPEELRVTSFVWSPDSSRLALVVAVKTDEHGVDRETEEDEEGKHDEGSKKKASTKLSERLGFKADGVGFVQDRRRHIHVIDVGSRELKRLTYGDYHADSPAWSPDGRHIAFASNRNPRWDVEISSHIWQISSDGGEPRRMTTEDGAWGSPVYSPSGKHLAFTGYPIREGTAVTGFAKLWRLDRRGQGMENLLAAEDLQVGNVLLSDCKLEASQPLIWDEAGIWFIVSEAGTANLCRWQEGLKRVTKGRHDVDDFSVAGDSVAYTRSDPTHPAEIFVQRGKSKPEQLSRVGEHYLESVSLTPPETISVRGAKGQQVEGWIMKPPLDVAAAHPLVVYIHGGPQTAYGETFFHEMQLLAAQGFGVLLINPHGSASHGEDYQSSIHGAWGGDDFKDVMAATDMAASLDWVDDKRIGIAGGSYGGYMGSWAIGHTDRYAAAVVERSLVNMLSFVGTTDVPNWWQYAWRTTVEDDPLKLWKMSPIAYLNKMSTPTLVIHSENDHRCPIEQGEQLFVGLRRRGVPTRFVRFPEESHGLSRGGKPSRRIERLHEIVGWLKRYL